MKICFISDTHGQHDFLPEFKDVDLLIHCGDVCSYGTEGQARNFITWFNSLEIANKVFIAGNHDFWFEQVPNEEVIKLLKPNVHYLNDSGITINGLKIWGSPVQPWFFNWAFNRQRGEDINRHWNLIPAETDILITHGPPFGILDHTQNRENVGCEDLLLKVLSINPKIHAFGHIHEAYGQRQLRDKTIFINASVLDQDYRLVNDPITFNL